MKTSYLSLLLESTFYDSKSNIHILIEGYNPEAVKTNTKNFLIKAKEYGFDVPNSNELNYFDQKDKFSIYFIVKRNEEHKIRVSDHPKNLNYVFDVNINCISDRVDNNMILDKVILLVKLDNTMKQIIKDTYLKLNYNFIIDYLKNYDGNPNTFDLFLKKYHIKPMVKRYKWFRKLLNNKCLEVVSNDKSLFKYYQKSFIYGYDVNNDELFKHY